MKWRFWKWFFIGINGKSGIAKLLDWWLLAHVIIAVGLAFLIDVNLKEAASTFLLPLASIFIGLSFAWAGNAQAIMQETEIEKFIKVHPDGIENYVYTFQLAILSILVTLVAWGLAGLGVFEKPLFKQECVYFGVKSVLYFLASITLRECWHIVLGGQLLILARNKIRDEGEESAVK